jgi:glycosyltransferase involved in cell wall biosynthesis
VGESLVVGNVDLMHEARPELAVVTATPDGFGRLQKLLQHLAAQTIAERIELVVVAPTAELPEGDRADALNRATVVPVGPIHDVDRALAAGIRASHAPVVAIIEDHAYPSREWAEVLVDAHRGGWEVVGTAFENANPGSSLSWANMVMAYGPWLAQSPSRVVSLVSRHNSSFKRDVLLHYGDELGDRLVRGGGLLEDLSRRGCRLFFDPRARIAHVNPSKLRSTLRLRFDSGRLTAASRADHERWSPLRRAFYIAASPLIPIARLRHIVPVCATRSLRATFVRTLPALTLALTVDALGQAVGFARGPGGSETRLRTFELDRGRQVRASDRAILRAVSSDRVAVVIPARNVARFAVEAIESVRKQTLSDWEVVVVDNDSSDGIADVVANCRDRRVRIVHEKRLGVARARNAGLAATSGDLVIFLDADDRLRPRTLERLRDALSAHPEADVAYTTYVKIDAQGRIRTDRPLPFAPTPSGHVLEAMLAGCFVKAPGAALVRRSALERVGAFDPAVPVAEDWELWCRIATSGQFVFVHDPEALLEYRLHPDAATRRFRLIRYRRTIEHVFSNPEVRAAVPSQRLSRLRRRQNSFVCTFLAIQRLREADPARARIYLRRAAREYRANRQALGLLILSRLPRMPRFFESRIGVWRL